MEKPFKFKDNCESNRFIHISTDEVYGSLNEDEFFLETSQYKPNSPYSASKASSDLLVRSFSQTYGMNCVVTNCSNNYGPGQHEEKLIPTIINKAIKEESIPIYGDGKYIRDWLYVEDHCSAIDKVFHKSANGEKYNIGGECQLDNLEVVNYICNILDKRIPRKTGSYKELIEFVSDRPGHDRRYAIDNSKITKDLGWSPKVSFETGINKTVDWYLESLSK